jgi:hypothetical protein
MEWFFYLFKWTSYFCICSNLFESK